MQALSDLGLLAEDVTSATDTDLEGDKSHTSRYTVARNQFLNPYISPATVVACGIRDAEKYGSLQLDKLDTNSFSHSRCGTHVFEKAIGMVRSCAKAVHKTIGTFEKMGQNARALDRKATAGKSGARGASVKKCRMRVVLSDQTPEEREKNRVYVHSSYVRERVQTPDGRHPETSPPLRRVGERTPREREKSVGRLPV
ncbi:unnamed protein product [Ectocarpus sp. 13 AM-2016]